MVAAGGSAWTVLFDASGRVDREMMTPGPGQVNSTGEGLIHTAHIFGLFRAQCSCLGHRDKKKKNSQPPARHIVTIESDQQFK